MSLQNKEKEDQITQESVLAYDEKSRQAIHPDLLKTLSEVEMMRLNDLQSRLKDKQDEFAKGKVILCYKTQSIHFYLGELNSLQPA